MILSIIFEYGGYYADGSISWWGDLSVAVVGALISSLFTVFALYKTFKKDKEKEDIRRIQFQVEKLKYFQSLIHSILNGLKNQNEFYKDFSNELRKDLFKIPIQKFISFNELKRVVDKLNLEDYYHSYLSEFGDNKEIITEFKQIISCLDYFNSQIELYRDSLVKSNNFDFERKTRLRNIIVKVQDEMSDMIINKDLQKYEGFCGFINEFYVNFYKNIPATYDLKYLHDNFVMEIKNDLLEYAKVIPEASHAHTQLKNSSILFKEISLQNVKLAEDFEELHNTFKEKIGQFEGFANRIIHYDS